MQITPFIKTVGEWMPGVMGITSFVTSVLYLGVYKPLEFYKEGQNCATRTPYPGGKNFSTRDHTKKVKKLQYECRAHAFNICGTMAFVYFSQFSKALGLISGYLLWTGHYIAKLEEKMLAETPSNKDRLWIVLYGFGAITCIACALFAHEVIPITTAIVVARVFSTTLSSVETGLFFYNLSPLETVCKIWRVF